MRIEDIHSVYFIGIGGIGMSALARYFNKRGVKVSGYDLHSTDMTRQLQREGIWVTQNDSVETIDKTADMVIYTPAVPKNHVQLNYYLNHNYEVRKRAEVLGMISNNHYSICVAGSHGKTTTSSLITHILKTAHKDTGAFLGGVTVNYNTNYLDGNKYVVVEADEYDHSFLQLQPDIALVTSIDTDHLDIYGNFEAIQKSFADFLKGVKSDGIIILNKKVSDEILPDRKTYTYSLTDESADFYTTQIVTKNAAIHFQLNTPKGTIENLVLNYGGLHNVENAVAAAAIAIELDIPGEFIREALSSFKGVERRFQVIYKSEKYVLIDDYAHHPRELDAVISAIRNLYGGQHLTVIFQPHLYSRTRDLADDFAQSLDQADSVILLPIYPARELLIEGISSSSILNQMTNAHKAVVDKNSLIDFLKAQTSTELILMAGAGDINLLLPMVSQWLKSKE